MRGSDVMRKIGEILCKRDVNGRVTAPEGRGIGAESAGPWVRFVIRGEGANDLID